MREREKKFMQWANAGFRAVRYVPILRPFPASEVAAIRKPCPCRKRAEGLPAEARGDCDPEPTIVMMQELQWLDAMLDTARMFRSNELAKANMTSPGVAEVVDANEQRLDAFTIGTFDELTAAHETEFSLAHLLAYLLKVIDNGPGEFTLEETSRLLSLKYRGELTEYIRVGRKAVRELLAGEQYAPGAYLELLLGELPSN